MALRIRCKCGYSQKVSSNLAGKTVTCPACRKVLLVSTGAIRKPEAGSAPEPTIQQEPQPAHGAREPEPSPVELDLCPADPGQGDASPNTQGAMPGDAGQGPPSPPHRRPRLRCGANPEAEWETTEAVEVRFGQKWLLIIGLAIMVLGVGYFLKYAFDQNWIGPPVRVALAYLLGLLCLGAGELFRRRRYAMFGLYLAGGGIAVLYFAGYAAFQIYALIDQPIAFGLMVFVTVLAGAMALFHGSKWLAILGIIGGFSTPVVLNTGTDNQLTLMVYLAILNTAVICIAAFKRWNLLSYLGFAFTWVLFAAWYHAYYAPPKFWMTVVFLNLFFLIYALLPFVHSSLRRDPLRGIDFAVTIPNAFIAFGFSFVIIRECYSRPAVSIVSIAYAAIFLTLAAFLRRRARENVEAFAILVAKGLLFLTITIPLLFSGHWVTIFWTAQAATLLWAALRIGNDRLRQGALVLLLVATAKFAIRDYPVIFQFHCFDASGALALAYASGFKYLLVERWITTIVVLASLLGSVLVLKAAEAHDEDIEQDARKFVRGAFIFLLFLMLNFEVVGYFHDYTPRATFASISVLWTLFSVGLIVFGFVMNQAALRYCAIGLFIATVLKVMLWDMSDVSTPYRILSFLVLGMMLIGASYLYHRHKGRILATAMGNEAPR
jgi:uncharacterized membrane protein